MFPKKLIRVTTIPQSLNGLLRDQLRFMNNYFEVIAISSDDTALYSFGKVENVKVIPVTMTRTISPLKDIKAIVKSFFILKKEKPFIVHTHTPKAGLVGMVAAKLAKVPYKLHTVAGLPLMESTGIKRKILEFVEKVIYGFADKVYPNSYGLKDFILHHNLCKPEKLKVIGNGSSNGIDTAFFDKSEEIISKSDEIRQKYDIKNEDTVLCFIGRIVKDKGINELLLSFDNIAVERNDVKLLLVGPFENDLDPISDKSRKILNENNSVIHVGFQEDVRPFLAASDIFVFPSYREGFPNVVMQAGAMSLPCIVTNINGCNEIIEDGKNGLIIEPKSIEELKNAIVKLLDNKELRKELSGNARKMIVERYEQQFVWDEILKEYRSFEQAKN